MEKEKVLEQRKYKVNLIDRIAKKIALDTTDGSDHYKVTATLMKSGAFDYGNGTCVAIEYENLPAIFENVRVFDTRYESGITNNFDEWVRSYFDDYYGTNLKAVNAC